MECEDIGEGAAKAVKRPSFGRLTDVAKRLRLQSHATGDDCKCKRLNCFTNVTETERRNIIKEFNSLASHNKQSLYLAGLITVLPVARRRARKAETAHGATYSYWVRVMRDGQVQGIPVCRQAFLSMHGITKSRLKNILRSRRLEEDAPVDGRGRHANRPHKLTEAKLTAIKRHIASFGEAHSSHSDTSKLILLPKELSFKKMHDLFMEKYTGLPVSYETFRGICRKHFNISFRCPLEDKSVPDDDNDSAWDPGLHFSDYASVAELLTLDRQKDG